MKTIKQLSAELKISKEAIYKKIKFQLKEPLKDHIVKFDNVTHIDEEGEQIIINSLSIERQEAINDIMNSDAVGTSDNNQPHLNEYINLLKDQIKTKDIQLDTQNVHITQLINQLGNNQLLIQSERYRNMLYLKEVASTTEEPVQVNSFWKRIFTKSKERAKVNDRK